MAKATGIGGVFFKAKDPETLKGWYVKYLGVEVTEWGGVLFNWGDDQKVQDDGGMTPCGTWPRPTATGSRRAHRSS